MLSPVRLSTPVAAPLSGLAIELLTVDVSSRFLDTMRPRLVNERQQRPLFTSFCVRRQNPPRFEGISWHANNELG